MHMKVKDSGSFFFFLFFSFPFPFPSMYNIFLLLYRNSRLLFFCWSAISCRVLGCYYAHRIISLSYICLLSARRFSVSNLFLSDVKICFLVLVASALWIYKCNCNLGKEYFPPPYARDVRLQAGINCHYANRLYSREEVSSASYQRRRQPLWQQLLPLYVQEFEIASSRSSGRRISEVLVHIGKHEAEGRMEQILEEIA